MRAFDRSAAQVCKLVLLVRKEHRPELTGSFNYEAKGAERNRRLFRIDAEESGRSDTNRETMSDRSTHTTELCELLTTVCDWLSRSEESDWAALSPPQVIEILQREINALQSGQYFENVVELTLLFCVTAEIQEISMASGWSDEYLKLAARFDELIDLVR